MRSVFLRRLIVALISAMLLASIAMLAGYMIISQNTFSDIKLGELLPKADAVKQLLTEYRNGQISEGAFVRMGDKLMVAAQATTLIVDADGSRIQVNKSQLNLTDEEIESGLSGFIDDILNGKTVSSDDVSIHGVGGALVAGVPVTAEESGEIIGAVLIIKSTAEVTGAARRLSLSLFWIVAIVVPIIVLGTSWRVTRITTPLHDMSEAAIMMSQGDFDIRVNEDEQGEVGVLAGALNNLCETLSKTIFQLRTEKGQLNQLLQSLNDGVAATDGIGTLTHYNTALMRMFGAVSAATREELIPDPLVWRAFDEVFDSGEPQSITYPMAGDRTLWITVSPVVTDDGEITGVVGLFKDMTEMERLEAMRREYVANVSHELRTPLTAVRGLLEPLTDGMVKDEADKQRYYKIMLHEVMRLSRLITDMMTLSRLQSGTEYMEVSRVNINELVDDIASGYASNAKKKKIDLIVDAVPVPDAVTDPDRIEQVLVILIDNAMRYTPEDGSITIGVRNGERIELTVTDTGCGIPEKDVGHIFERFYKVDKSRGEGGTGLGLSIAKFIMDKLGESFTVESELGKGTRFTMTVKKYVRNAIALGPAGEGCSIYEGERDEKAKKPVDDERRPNGVVDAQYEVIPDPPKRVDAQKKPENMKKPEGVKRTEGLKADILKKLETDKKKHDKA